MYKIIYSIPIIIIAILLMRLSDIAAIDNRVPITYSNVEVLDSDIFAGDVLPVRIHRKKVRDDCILLSSRTAEHIDGTLYNLPDSITRGGKSTEDYVDIDYSTVSNMKPGIYSLIVKLTYLCPGNQLFPLNQPISRFTVLESPINE